MKTEPSQKTLKSRLRKEIRGRRGAIGQSSREEWDTAICRELVDRTTHSRVRSVAAYMAFDGEPDLGPALAELEARGVRISLPVVQDTPGKAVIVFREWTSDALLVKNRYGISEPAATAEVRMMDIDLVLVPLVGWDRSGARLGMGASFYDRLFQPFSVSRKPLRVGVGYELQYSEEIPAEPWDIDLHVMLTENGWFTCGG